jgi:hypothetical protein
MSAGGSPSVFAEHQAEISARSHRTPERAALKEHAEAAEFSSALSATASGRAVAKDFTWRFSRPIMPQQRALPQPLPPMMIHPPVALHLRADIAHDHEREEHRSSGPP